MTFIFLYLILIAQTPSRASQEPAREMKALVSHSLPRYTFHFTWSKDVEHPTVEAVQVFIGDSKPPVQVLDECLMGQPPLTPSAPEKWFELEDLNFDGYSDIAMEQGRGATGNVQYCIWLFDPSAGRFVFNPQFSDAIGNHTIDRENKTISTSSNGSADLYQRETYTVEGNRLQLIIEEKQEESSGRCPLHWSRRELQRGTLTVVEEKWLDRDGNQPCAP